MAVSKKPKRKKSVAALKREVENADRAYMHAHGVWTEALAVSKAAGKRYAQASKEMDKADDRFCAAEIALGKAEGGEW